MPLRFAVNRHVAARHIFAEPGIRRIGGAGDHRRQRGIRVEPPDALQIGVGDHRSGVIADHRPRLAPLELPDGQDAVGTVVAAGDERADDVARRGGRLHERQQRMFGAERIPQREGRPERIAVRAMDLIVRPAIATVDVAGDGRGEEAVIERGRDRSLHRRGRVDPQHVERGVPCGRGSGGDRVEIAGFAQQVGDRTRLVDRGDGAGDLNRAIGGAEIEPGDERPPGAFGHRVAAAPGTLEALVRDIGLGRHEGVPRQWHRKADGEAEISIRRPAARLAAAGDDAVGTQPDRRPQDLAG